MEAVMKLSRGLHIVLLLLLCGAVAAFAADDKAKVKPESADSRDHGTWKEKRFVATPAADGVQRFEIVGGGYYYDPNYIVVKVNIPVEMKYRKAEGYVPHNLIVKAPEAGIDINVDLKETPQTVRFTPTKVGKFPMYCDKSLLWFKTHREKGMEGLIEVVK
jgi:plastocyanin